MSRSINIALISLGILAIFFYISFSVNALSADEEAIFKTSTPTVENNRLKQPPTVIPPAQENNGTQIYWGDCMDCHGDQGQGLTIEWLESFPLDTRDCWISGCHGEDFPENSFEIPPSGIPAIAGTDTLILFTNTFDLWKYIKNSMPRSSIGSLSEEDAWALTAYILSLNKRQIKGITLSDANGAVIPVHHDVEFPKSDFEGVILLVGVMGISTLALTIHRKQNSERKMRSKVNFVHHLHPVLIPRVQSRFRYTLGAGGLAIFFSLILLVTGIFETYYYIPSPEQAAISVEKISLLVPFGRLIRNLHFWSAQFLLIISIIHLLRVTLTGAYAPPRSFNYLLGLGLLVLIFMVNFTGYVLRWDEGIQWALVVGTNLFKTIPLVGERIYRFIIGGNTVNQSTLIRFYAWHSIGLALPSAFLVGWHVFRLRRDGGIAATREKLQGNVNITRFELVRREVIAMIISGIILLIFSLLFSAPMDRPITDMNAVIGDSQAPWFFIWLQQLLKWGNPFIFGLLIPLVVIIVLGLLPYIFPNADNEELGVWFVRGNRIAQYITIFIIFSILLLTIFGALSNK